MKPDHEAAKKWAESLGPENTFGVCGPDMLNLARAYLDLLARLQRAVELLQSVVDDEQCQLDHHGVCQTHWGRPCGMAKIRAFLRRKGR